jgi:putative transposase
MDEYASLNHTVWECKYHVVFIPKCRRKSLYGELRNYLGDVLHRLAQQRENRILEGHLMSDWSSLDYGNERLPQGGHNPLGPR